MDMAKYTEAQKRANIKYLAEKTDDIRVHAPKGTRERWKQAANRNGLSLQRYIINVVEEKIAQEEN